MRSHALIVLAFLVPLAGAALLRDSELMLDYRADQEAQRQCDSLRKLGPEFAGACDERWVATRRPKKPKTDSCGAWSPPRRTASLSVLALGAP